MNYTEKYHLPQWEKTDRIMMDDFNRMCADMESGLSANADAASAARTKADTGVSNAAAAQAAADKAQASADRANTTADAAYCPSFKPYAIGNYTGQGETTNIEVTLGFRPSFLIVTAQESTNNDTSIVPTNNCFMIGNKNLIHYVTFTATGFIITPDRNWPNMGLYTPGTVYCYLAFR